MVNTPEIAKVELGKGGRVTVVLPREGYPNGAVIINDGKNSVVLDHVQYVALRNAVEGRYTYRPDLLQEIEEEGFYTDCLLAQPEGVALLDEMADAFSEMWDDEQTIDPDGRNYYEMLEYVVDLNSERIRALAECCDSCPGCARREAS